MSAFSNNNQLISNYKTFQNAILQTILPVTITANIATCDFNQASIFFIGSTPSGNFRLALTNFPTPSQNNVPYCVTLITNQTISTGTGFYANSISVNGTVSSSIYFNNGSSSVSTSLQALSGKSGTVIQQFTIYTIAKLPPQTILCNVNVLYP
jgi:hypothetical protein